MARWGTESRGGGSGRRERRRARAREDRARQEAPAATTAPTAAPLVWGAGVGCRVLAALWLGQLALLSPFAYGTGLAGLTAMEWLLRLWTLGVALWIFARLGAWRVTADRDGVAMPRLFSVERLPWDEVGKAVARRDGCVLVGSRTTGPFLPAPLARLLRRPDGARAMADRLMVMVRHPELRPTGRADARTRSRPYVVWAPLPLAVLAAAHLLAG
ncbi:hypothetical protein [Streptomyces californicus]|uniref:hypothetical protein n=1 Tax=Streptomyces californicus TaxID=67351 RepID=UPI0036CF24AF